MAIASRQAGQVLVRAQVVWIINMDENIRSETSFVKCTFGNVSPEDVVNGYPSPQQSQLFAVTYASLSLIHNISMWKCSKSESCLPSFYKYRND